MLIDYAIAAACAAAGGAIAHRIGAEIRRGPADDSAFLLRALRRSRQSPDGGPAGALRSAASVVESVCDPEDAAERIVESALALFGSELSGAALIICRAGTKEALIAASRGLPIYRMSQQLLRAAEQCFYSRSVRGAGNTGRLQCSEEFSLFGIGSSVLLPLAGRGVTYGALFLGFRSELAGAPAAGRSSFDAFAELAAAVLGVSAMLQSRTDLSFTERDYLLGLSHDLRTPALRMQEAAAELFDTMDYSVPENHRRLLELLQESARDQLVMIEQVLCSAEADRGLLCACKEQAPLRRAVEVLERHVRPAVEAGGNRFAVAPAPLCTIEVDISHFVRILGNFISNAAAHTQGGEIEVCFEQTARYVKILVADTGRGVAPDERVHLFGRRPFSTSRGRPGSRLGLRAVRALAEVNGGEVWYEPREGGGSVFGFAVPKAANPLRPPWHPAAVVIADDQPSGLRAIERALPDSVSWVVKAGAAAELQSALDKEPRPEAVITDLFLGGESAWRLIEELGAETAVVLVTGAAPAFLPRQIPANVAVLQKPFQKQQLTEALAEARAGVLQMRKSLSKQGRVPV